MCDRVAQAAFDAKRLWDATVESAAGLSLPLDGWRSSEDEPMMAGDKYPLNIWYLNHYAGGPRLGRYSRAFHLARAWAALDYSTTVFVARFHHLLDDPSPLPPETNIDGVRYLSLPARSYGGNGIGRLLNIADYCRAIPTLRARVDDGLTKPDVIIVTSPHPFAIYPARQLARYFGAVLVFEARDLWSLSMTVINGASPLHPFIALCRHAESFAYRNADIVASTLPNTAQYLRERGLPTGGLIYVPNGIEPDNPVKPSSPVSQLGREAALKLAEWREQGRAVVIHPGALGEASGLDRLLEAVSLLKSDGLESRFGILLPGHGELAEKLKGQATRLGLDNVAFSGRVPKSEALWLTARSDIGYAGGRDHPRLYQYGISFNKIMDFMEAGLPIILPVSATGDPVSASGCGIITGSDRPSDIAGAIARLIGSSPEERRLMGQKGRDYAIKHFDYRNIAATYAEAMAEARSRFDRPSGKSPRS